jgi:bacteriorhodopsin
MIMADRTARRAEIALKILGRAENALVLFSTIMAALLDSAYRWLIYTLIAAIFNTAVFALLVALNEQMSTTTPEFPYYFAVLILVAGLCQGFILILVEIIRDDDDDLIRSKNGHADD